jgi:hypothetical protein
MWKLVLADRHDGPLQNRMSAAWWTGYVYIAALTVVRPAASISSVTARLASASRWQKE